MTTRETARDAVRDQAALCRSTPGPVASLWLSRFAIRYLLGVIKRCNDGTVRAVAAGVEDGLKEAGVL